MNSLYNFNYRIFEESLTKFKKINLKLLEESLKSSLKKKRGMVSVRIPLCPFKEARMELFLEECSEWL